MNCLFVGEFFCSFSQASSRPLSIRIAAAKLAAHIIKIGPIILGNKCLVKILISEYPKTYSTPETRFDVSEERKFAIVEEIKKSLLYSNVKVISIDGVRVESKKGWWGIRASNTQNALTVRAEALDKDSLKEMIKKIENELKLSGVNFKFSF